METVNQLLSKLVINYPYAEIILFIVNKKTDETLYTTNFIDKPVAHHSLETLTSKRAIVLILYLKIMYIFLLIKPN